VPQLIAEALREDAVRLATPVAPAAPANDAMSDAVGDAAADESLPGDPVTLDAGAAT
jgi:hypothetical protein